MRKLLIAAAMTALIFTNENVHAQSQGVVIKQSAFSVKVTLDRLQAIFGEKGITVFARIDHAAGAKRVKKDLPPTELIIFGNPKIGTPLMESSILAGLDLPLKALVYQDASEKVFLAYTHPSFITRRHGIKDRNKLSNDEPNLNKIDRSGDEKEALD